LFVSTQDGGNSWTPAVAAPITEPDKFGCEASMISVVNLGGATNRTLFFAEPAFNPRITLRFLCSCDGGVSWPHQLLVNAGVDAQYSAMLPVTDDARLFVVWETNATLVSYTFETEWCLCHHHPNK
jgi:hypothetical protein